MVKPKCPPFGLASPFFYRAPLRQSQPPSQRGGSGDSYLILYKLEFLKGTAHLDPLLGAASFGA